MAKQRSDKNREKKEVQAIIKKYRPKWHQRISFQQNMLGLSSGCAAGASALGTAALLDPTGTSAMTYFAVSFWFAWEARDDLKRHREKTYTNSAGQKITGNSQICLAMRYLDQHAQKIYKQYENTPDAYQLRAIKAINNIEKDARTLCKYMDLTDQNGHSLDADDLLFCLNREDVIQSLGQKEMIKPRHTNELRDAFTLAKLAPAKEKIKKAAPPSPKTTKKLKR